MSSDRGPTGGSEEQPTRIVANISPVNGGAGLHGPAGRWWDVAGILLIVVVTFVAYIPALRAGYVWDDREYVWANDLLRSLGGLRQIWLAPTSSPAYSPLVFTTFWLEFHLWGTAPFGYHLTNVALHTLNSLLVWLLLRRLNVPGAFLAGAIFALHPVHVESVAWIAERKDVLSCSFYLFALWVWLRFMARPTWSRYLSAVALFLGAMLSKTIAVTFPLILLLLGWWQGQRHWKRELVRVVPFLVIGAGLGWLNVWRESFVAHTVVVPTGNPFLIAGHAVWFYVAKLLWPADLTTIYPLWNPNSPEQLLFPLAVCGVAGALWWSRSRLGGAPLVAFLFFVITLAPVLGFVRFGYLRVSFVADHLQYLASIGVIAVFAALVARITERVAPSRRAAGVLVAAPILMTLGVLTWQQGHIYTNEEILWRDNLRQNPVSWDAHYNLGTLLMERGQMAEALPHLQMAVGQQPYYPLARKNLGTVLANLGMLDEAIEQFRIEARVEPGVADGQSNWGLALAMQGKLDEAIEHYQLAARIDAHHLATQYNWGRALEAQGKLDEALQHYGAAARIDPQQPQVQRHLQRLMEQTRAAP
jgi:tetratricopeptide (TPR) repeat protein